VQRLLLKCNNRKVVFDNRTKPVKENQVTELLKQIDSVLFLNDGHPYTNEMFREAQVCVRISERSYGGNEYM